MKTMIVFVISLIISSYVMAQTGSSMTPQRQIKKDQHQSKLFKDFETSLSTDEIKKSDIPGLDVLKKIIDRGLLTNNTTASLLADKNFRKKYASGGKQNLDSMIYERFDPDENMWMDDYKDLFTYNSDGNQLTSIYYEKDSLTGEWTGNYKDQYEYDSSDRQILYISYSWDFQNEDWVGNYKEESAYDSAGNLILFAYYHNESENGEWMGYNKEESEFDSDGNLILTINYSWDDLENKWMGSDKSEYIFENGVKKFDRLFIWDPESNGWLSREVLAYEYLDDLLVSIITTGVDNNWDGEINNLDWFKTGFFYNPQGNLTSEINYENNDENIAWEAVDKTEYTYNTDQELETTLYSFLIDEEWVIYYKYSFTYDPNGSMPSITMSIADGSDWLPAYIDLYNYDSDGNLILHVTSFYDFEYNVWEDDVKEEYIYDTNGNLISAILYDYDAYKVDFTYNNSYSFEELNIPNDFPIEYFNHMLTEAIEYDLIDDEWLAVNRSKLFYSENNSSGIPENIISGIRVFPNPASGSVTFHGNFGPERTSVEFFDLYGKKVKSETLPANGQLSVQQLPSGMYFYKLRSTGITTGGKIIIK